MKQLATVIYSIAPDLNPRIDGFPPTLGLPREGVVLDVWDGKDQIPSVRLVCWPSGSTWQAVFIVYESDSLDVMSINEFTDRAYSDATAPRWAFGAVWALLQGKMAEGLLEAHGVEQVEKLPATMRGIYGAIWLKGARMQMIYHS